MWKSGAHLDIRASTVILFIFIIENEFLISVEQEFLTLPEHLNSSHVLCVVCVAQSLGSCVVFLDHCFFFAIMLSILIRFTFSDCPLVIFKLEVSGLGWFVHVLWLFHSLLFHTILKHVIFSELHIFVALRNHVSTWKYNKAHKIKVPRNYALWQYYIKLICMWFWQNDVRKFWTYQRSNLKP